MSIDILAGDCRDVLKTLPDQSVHCVVTSPPYFGLRDYGVDGQMGLEATPTEFVAEMVAVFREVRRVLRDDGTLWLNLGDSYSSGGGDTYSGFNARYDGTGLDGGKQAETAKHFKKTNVPSLPPKNLIGIPWRVAFALRADGWYLRQDIIWHKPNPMPESVRDRCTKAHEYMFVLSKSEQYHFDAEAIAEPVAESSIARFSQDIGNQRGSVRVPGKTNGPMKAVGRRNVKPGAIMAAEPVKRESTFGFGELRNKRSVWTVSTQPFKEAHFATFPPALIEPCIKAGCPSGGMVLDPFGGAGTTGLVADRLGRNAILIELNPEYIEIARRRIADDAGLFADLTTRRANDNNPEVGAVAA